MRNLPSRHLLMIRATSVKKACDPSLRLSSDNKPRWSKDSKSRERKNDATAADRNEVWTGKENRFEGDCSDEATSSIQVAFHANDACKSNGDCRLHEGFGTESRVRNASVRTERQALRQEQQQHYPEFAVAREGLRAEFHAQNIQQ